MPIPSYWLPKRASQGRRVGVGEGKGGHSQQRDAEIAADARLQLNLDVQVQFDAQLQPVLIHHLALLLPASFRPRLQLLVRIAVTHRYLPSLGARQRHRPVHRGRIGPNVLKWLHGPGRSLRFRPLAFLLEGRQRLLRFRLGLRRRLLRLLLAASAAPGLRPRSISRVRGFGVGLLLGGLGIGGGHGAKGWRKLRNGRGGKGRRRKGGGGDVVGIEDGYVRCRMIKDCELRVRRSCSSSVEYLTLLYKALEQESACRGKL